MKAGDSSLQLSEERLALLHSLRPRPSNSPVSTATVQPRAKENLEGLRSRYPGIRISFAPPGKFFKEDGDDCSSTEKGKPAKKKMVRNMATVSKRKLLEQNPLVTVSRGKSLPVDQKSGLHYWSDPRQVLHDAREEEDTMEVDKSCYDVERLLDYRNGKYLVKWVGYSEEDRSPEIQLAGTLMCFISAPGSLQVTWTVLSCC